jgi:3',5'-cyclic AMP phosphodiesterase CpdA
MILFKRLITLLLISGVFSSPLFSQSHLKNLPPKHPQFDYKATPKPDRILLSWSKDAHTTQTVTWRTDTTVAKAYAQIAIADPSPEFHEYDTTYTAETVSFLNPYTNANYHTVTFENLKPNTHYAYRVGSKPYWSEWIQFKTATAKAEPFSFIYMGDAQNKLYSHWSRAIRAAYAKAPNAKFIIHAGDLINHSQNDYEWGEWFRAGSFIHSMIPSIIVPGNHEYIKIDKKKIGISPYWNPQFNFTKNGPEGLEDESYYTDYQNCKIIALNTNENFAQQAQWLEEVLKNNKKDWVFVILHHPIISAAKGRVNEGIMNNWKPIFDKYKVDMVLQGHDHTYGRGQNVNSGLNAWDEDSGTVYVVSVSGPKTYSLSDHEWMTRSAENTQLYQVIDIENDKLTYKAYTVNDKIYDAFEIIKAKGKNNVLKELQVDIKEERRFENTLKDPDEN